MSEAAQLELIRNMPGILAAIAAIISVILVNRVRDKVSNVAAKVEDVQIKTDEIHTQTNGLTAAAIAAAVEAERAQGILNVEAERARNEATAIAAREVTDARLDEARHTVGETPSGTTTPKTNGNPGG